ncbi:YtcA family lipoprotein [Pseudoxanthobacter sp.]|uniref:YtcA family lipoprotein n=1 Tax=Pseudoxanthobacter sp. TaxID=1925742 RepID=UPI002FE264C6
MGFLLRSSGVATLCLLCTGCTLPAVPSISLFGAYFPFWMLTAGTGIIGALLIRAVLIRAGIDDLLPFRLVVYTSLAAALAFALALGLYGR